MDEGTDITPSWESLLPVLLGVLQNDKAPVTAVKQVEGELTRMAALADKWVEFAYNTGTPGEELFPRLGDPDAQEV